jgi:hypothetical protein
MYYHGIFFYSSSAPPRAASQHVGVLGSILRKLFLSPTSTMAAVPPPLLGPPPPLLAAVQAAAPLQPPPSSEPPPAAAAAAGPPQAQQPPAGHSIKRRSPVWAKFRLLGATDAPHTLTSAQICGDERRYRSTRGKIPLAPRPAPGDETPS